MPNPNNPNKSAKNLITADQAKVIRKGVLSAVSELSEPLAVKLQNDSSLSIDNLTGITATKVIDLFSSAIDPSIEALTAPDLTAALAKSSSSDKDELVSKTKSTVKGVVSSQTGPQTFKRPIDVSCSMSIMGYKETKATFGAGVADNYLAIQVTVRNLSGQDEFLIHDVQAAVDTGVGQDYFGRFQSGRDKLLVRAVVQRGQVTDPRNLIINSLQVVGAIAAVPTAGQATELATAVAIFNGQFVPGLSNIIPDPTLTYTNHVNDLSFSSSPSSRTVVPVKGSIPFVTFIAQKPIQELPFAWCGYTTQERRWKKGPFFGFPSYGSVREYCQDPGQASSSLPGESGTAAYKGNYNPAKPTSTENDTAKDALEWDDLPYKKWKGAALRILEQNTFVVVGGTHIKETGNTSLGNLTCPTFPDGSVDLSQTTDGLLACKLSGSGLNKVKSVKLEQDNDKIAGKLNPAADGNSADITFDPSLLYNSKGQYELYFVDSGGETDAQDHIELSEQPLITSLDKTELTAEEVEKAVIVGVKGKNLDLVESLVLTVGATPVTTTFTKPAKGATSLSATVAAGKLQAGESYVLGYTVSQAVGKTLQLPSIKLTVAGNSAAADTTTSFDNPKTVVKVGAKLSIQVKVVASAAGAIPTGPVQLLFGSTSTTITQNADTKSLDAKGTATLTFTAGKIAGKVYLKASYAGDKGKFAASSTAKPLQITVTK